MVALLLLARSLTGALDGRIPLRRTQGSRLISGTASAVSRIWQGRILVSARSPLAQAAVLH